MHRLADTSCIALGRLLTASVLTGFINNRAGSLSLQILSTGRVKQIFADVTETGEVRGYVRPADFALPRYPDDQLEGRRCVGAALGKGVLSVIQTAGVEEHRQSATNLVSGEIDVDVEHFLAASDQIAAAIRCDVLLADDGTVRNAGGMLVQALPGADLSRLDSIRDDLLNGGFAKQIAEFGADSTELLRALLPDAALTESTIPLKWKCRCTNERVLNALRTFDPVELAEMVDAGEPVSVNCDFCGQEFRVQPEQLNDLFISVVTEKA